MKWSEFVALLAGIGPETPLGRMVAIRSENDKEVLKHFSKDQKRIRSEWRNRKSQSMNQVSYDNAMKDLENMFRSMAK